MSKPVVAMWMAVSFLIGAGLTYLMTRPGSVPEPSKAGTPSDPAPRIATSSPTPPSPPPPPPPPPPPLPPLPKELAAVTVEADWAQVEVVAPGTPRKEEWVPAWFSIPAELQAMQFTKPRPYQGKLDFTVASDGHVLLAVSAHKWGDADHSGGPWKQELLSRDALKAAGWQEWGMLNDGGYLLLFRACKQGDAFSIRTKKYNGPVLFQPADRPSP